MKRRTFLKLAGIGTLSIAAGCNSRPEKNLFSLVEAPDDMVTGMPAWYASTCRECPAGCGILAKNREGRVVKLEGHPMHPVNRGSLCMRGQAALQGIYNPDRIRQPLLKQFGKWQTVSFQEAEGLLVSKLHEAAAKGSDRVRMITEMAGDSGLDLFVETLAALNSQPPLIYEAFSCESVKAANNLVFGVNGLPSYHMENADLIIGFGADFLETWLSPVEYARKFKEMHGYREGKKGLFIHVSPYQSLTGANADLWVSCMPSGEFVVALGLVREMLKQGRGQHLPEPFLRAIESVSDPFDRPRVFERSGISAETFDKLAFYLLRAQQPLILGCGMSGCAPLQTETSVNLLNRILDPELRCFDFDNRHRLEIAASHSEKNAFFDTLQTADILLIHEVNPGYHASSGSGLKEVLGSKDLFVVSFANFMDETTAMADLVFPVRMPLESWGEYGGKTGLVSTIQPAMGRLTEAPSIGDVFLRIRNRNETTQNTFHGYLIDTLKRRGVIADEQDWLHLIQHGGFFEQRSDPRRSFPKSQDSDRFAKGLSIFGSHPDLPGKGDLVFMAAPSIRFFDGRGANKPWLCEVPDTLTQVAWQAPVNVHPETLREKGIAPGDSIRIRSDFGEIETVIYSGEGIRPGVLVMAIGQGHEQYGRYADQMGANPFKLLPPGSSDPPFAARVDMESTGKPARLAHMDGSPDQHGRKIALCVPLEELKRETASRKPGLGMWDFPFTMPLPEGYDPKRDFYPPHEHEGYRWAMVIDLDRCIGCGACAVACYAENNIGLVMLERILEQREMSWLAVQRYLDNTRHGHRPVFIPMLCQHCDNAPCEAVCPVYAPHHSKEGINNQIYNRCIGTRFCSQNCPYKVRRFNWFTWQWPEPLNLQLNPDVTVRAKGVMEKCSFCIQRIKYAHGTAKNETRDIRDGEIQPACLQTCPTGVFTFGNLMDRSSRVRQMVEDRRAYQVMGYLNTKPAVIYLKKVIQEL
jgi:molybdopterin-containing oxidoreductase family iron-sulfur binding subunit